jgi:hypothetical protein
MVSRPRFRKKHLRHSSSPGHHLELSSSPEEYKVGPGRPPREFQWKPGQSGNPKGAKRKAPSVAPDLKLLVERALNEKVRLKQGDKERVLTKAAVGIEQLVNQYAKGDRHARRDLIALADKLGVDLTAGQGKIMQEALAPDHKAILDAYVRRRSNVEDSSSASPRVIAPPELLDNDSEN